MTTEKQRKLTLTNDAIFFTIQGEGKYIGIPSVFIRTSTCNLRCEWANGDGTYTKCDTPYSSHNPEINVMPIEDILAEVLKYQCEHVVISGGEPLLQPNIDLLVDELVKKKKLVTIETNGTLYRKDNKAQFFSISPKLATSCPHTSKEFERHHSNRLNFHALADLCKKPHQLKFVVAHKADIEEIELMIKQIAVMNGGYDCRNVWLMPQGVTSEQFDKNLAWIAEVVKEKNWNLTDRLHVRIWGSKRGV